MNQTTIMHSISRHYCGDYVCFFTPYYADGFIDFLTKRNLLNFTILSGKFRINTENYLKKNNLKIDYKGTGNKYDLIYTCSDLIVPRNIKNQKLILVQEGMTDPENFMYYTVKYLGLPRYLASTATTGLSHEYDYFCVASEGYRDHFIKKGVNPDKIKVTGIPNFDNVKQFIYNDFPHKNYVLVATSDARETFKYENRKKNIEFALRIANGRQIIFKLHPNEKFDRAVKEISKYAPKATVYTDGKIEHMIANCDILITQYSSVVYIGIALRKKVYSNFDLASLYRMTPIQNNGRSAEKIANVGKELMACEKYEYESELNQFTINKPLRIN